MINTDGPNVKYLVYSGKVRTIHKDNDGLWRDSGGTIYALTESTASVDPNNGCGVWPFDLPASFPLTAACSVHDNLYSNPAYQLFHTRKEADEVLENLSGQLETGEASEGFFTKTFYGITRLLGGFFWENKKTNN